MTDFLHFVLPGLPERKEKKLARDILADLPFMGGYVTGHGEQIWDTDIKHLAGQHDQMSHGREGGATGEQQYNLMTEGATLSEGYGGNREGFTISTDSGARANGYLYNADFPGDKMSPKRGELFYVEVPKHLRGKGIGKSLALDSFRQMKARGVETVNISGVTSDGRNLINSLIKNGIISEALRISQTGKAEYKILDTSSMQYPFYEAE